MKPKPWTALVSLKDELRSGELTLAQFAADLHEVALARGKRPIYENPAQFFDLTFPTPPLRELVKDVALRLSGKTDRAIRQLELTYGGGKTHTLITLYHLFRDPGALPKSPTVTAFREHVGEDLPQAFVATLCFDKIDAEKGIEDVRAPDGERRTLKHPWSVLAFQLAGAEGLRAVHADDKDEERETPPAEPLLTKLLEVPGRDGLGTLILVDEVLMYAREKAGLDPVWRDRIRDFFQYLNQAVAKVDRAAIVASLLATDPSKEQGDMGGLLKSDLFAVFRRQREEGVQPVRKEDVAEVLRRRFFQEMPDDDVRRNQAIAVVRGLAKLDETIAKDKAGAEDRFVQSFPFHPDMTDVFYSRWTQLDDFQRTRGILRTLATALREAEKWDRSPVVGASALLAAPGQESVSMALSELANTANSATAGKTADWGKLLQAEFDKARLVQSDHRDLERNREVEQAVVSVFLHSPRGGKVTTFELQRLAGTSGPDAIEFEKGLLRWRDVSWFLDDEDSNDDGQSLPKEWRLGTRPNLRNMHDEACARRVTDADVTERLLQTVRKCRSKLDGGAAAAGAKCHLLPASPADVADDGDFHYVILGPEATSDSGRPSAVAKRCIDVKSDRGQPRVARNSLVLAVPSRNGLEAARMEVRSLLGWEHVDAQLRNTSVDPLRSERLRRQLREARNRVPDVVRQAYGVVVTVNEENAVHAFKLPASAEPLFPQIKNDERSRIKETAVDAEALLPGGPYNLWREDEEARFVKDLAAPFARDPRLPKLLDTRILLSTVLQGVERGLLVARLVRPDGTRRTWWREPVESSAAADPALEAVLPEKAQLESLHVPLLGPDRLPGLWPADAGAAAEQRLPVRDLLACFAGGHVVQVAKQGYDDVLAVPACPADVVLEAVREAVEGGALWLVNGPSSCWKDEIPVGVLDKDAVLRSPPALVPVQEFTEEALPGAWKDGETNGAAIERALSHQRGESVPWGLVRESISEAVNSRWLDVVSGGAAGGYATAGAWRLKQPERRPSSSGAVPAPESAATPTTAMDVSQLLDLAQAAPKLLEASAGHGLCFHVGVSLDADAPTSPRKAVDGLLEEVAPGFRSGSEPA